MLKPRLIRGMPMKGTNLTISSLLEETDTASLRKNSQSTGYRATEIREGVLSTMITFGRVVASVHTVDRDTTKLGRF